MQGPGGLVLGSVCVSGEGFLSRRGGERSAPGLANIP